MKLNEIFNSKYYERKWTKNRKDIAKNHPEITWKVAPPVGIGASHAPAAAPYNG